MKDAITYDTRYKTAYRDLNLEWIEKYFTAEKKDHEQLDNPEECLAEGGQIFFVLDGERAIGTCAMYKTGEKQFELAKMAVSPSYRGQGLGDLLIDVSESWAKAQGAEEILILSNTVLEPAIRLYHKHGFKTTYLGPNPDYERANIELRKHI
jgi:GNAT superfamily N-acetyltransferase